MTATRQLDPLTAKNNSHTNGFQGDGLVHYQDDNPYAYAQSGATPAAYAEESERAAFIRNTYLHLAGAVGLFAIIEVIIFGVVGRETLLQSLQLFSGWSWLIVLGAFMGVSWLATTWASSSVSKPVQYAGLGLYILAEAVIFIPLLALATMFEGAIMSAAVMTGVIFGGLTLFVLVTKSDFTGLGKYLWFGGLAAMGMIVCSILFGFNLGTFFSVAMILLMSGYILYHTSAILHEYHTTQYVAASLALFASVATLFWYVLRLVMMFTSSD